MSGGSFASSSVARRPTDRLSTRVPPSDETAVHRGRSGGVAVLVVTVAMLSACSSMPAGRGGETAARPASAGGGPIAAAPTKKGGGYYLDDGPGDNPPPNLDLLPDAVPRVEKYASGANRPYNVFGVEYVPDLSGAPYRQRGVGSWYGRKFHGQRTSNGEIYDMYAMTAAHPTLPIPSYALVTNVQNGRSVIVRVNDRGPFLHNRVMDLSYAAAHKLGYMSSGSGMIEVEMLMPRDIAAGRIPATTNGLLASASSAFTPRAMPPDVALSAGPPVTPGTAPGTSVAAPVGVPASASPAVPPVAITAPDPSELSIEALTARIPVGPAAPVVSAGPPRAVVASTAAGLPPAPTVVADAMRRSLPLSAPPAGTPIPDTERAPEPVSLPDRQPPAALPTTATSSGYYLQLGAFRAKAGADSFASHLAREIDPALASRVHVSDANGLYRVRVGPYARRADADLAAAGLRSSITRPIMVMPDGALR